MSVPIAVKGMLISVLTLLIGYFVSWPSEGQERLDSFVADVLPEVRAL
ncbi:MAG: hypothetical protein ABR575_07045 [Actinomycetota bacterium]